MNEPFITIAAAVFDVVMLALILGTADGRRMLMEFLRPGPVTYWPPRAVIDQFRRKR